MKRFGFRLRLSIVRRLIPDAATVLDVGAGSGDMMAALRPVGVGGWCRAIVGLELARSAQEQGFRAGRLIVRGRAEHLPWPEPTFDAAISTSTWKHVADCQAMAREMVRVTRPGGTVLVLEPHPLIVWAGLLLGKFERRYLRRVHGARQIAAEFSAAGLHDVRPIRGLYVGCVGRI